jgi:hypothetical protein
MTGLETFLVGGLLLGDLNGANFARLDTGLASKTLVHVNRDGDFVFDFIDVGRTSILAIAVASTFGSINCDNPAHVNYTFLIRILEKVLLHNNKEASHLDPIHPNRLPARPLKWVRLVLYNRKIIGMQVFLTSLNTP